MLVFKAGKMTSDALDCLAIIPRTVTSLRAWKYLAMTIYTRQWSHFYQVHHTAQVLMYIVDSSLYSLLNSYLLFSEGHFCSKTVIHHDFLNLHSRTQLSKCEMKLVLPSCNLLPSGPEVQASALKRCLKAHHKLIFRIFGNNINALWKS